MSFFNFFRGFFGFPPDGNANRRGDLPDERQPNGFRNPIWSQDDDDDDDEDFSFLNRGPRTRSFRVDSNPLEIHRFFEQQIEDMMRSFGAFGFGSFGSRDFFSLEPPPMESEPDSFAGPSDAFKGGLREQYLKPGYESDSSRGRNERKMDSDLDDQVPAGEVSKILRQGPRLDVIEPERAQPFGSIVARSFGRSMTSKTVSRPNGGIEHHKSVRDSSGNEEVTVTRSIGGQSYTITTKTDAQGKQERIENFVNMDEGDLKEFEKKWGSKL
ncbi:hypothetical protein R5R35_004293 [Gryllus longicercus]|uniref:Accessory gland protein n=2 Tax=Gryllus TaxID=6998 RepID=A0AAN9VWP2_9ORTH